VNQTETVLDDLQLPLDMRFETSRQFYIRMPAIAVRDTALPSIFTHVVKRKGNIECQTLDLMKLNQKARMNLHTLQCS
jgi:DNA mismatch repair protein MSH4